MKTLIPYLISMAIATLASAQTLTPVVIAGGGGYDASGGAYLSWTLGQTGVATLADAGVVLYLTQGFQQPEHVGLVPVIEILQSEGRLSLRVYPNPTVDELYLDWNTTLPGLNWQAIFTDMTGKILLQRRIQSPTETFDLRALPAGMYFLRVTDGVGVVRAVKVVVE